MNIEISVINLLDSYTWMRCEKTYNKMEIQNNQITFFFKFEKRKQ